MSKTTDQTTSATSTRAAARRAAAEHSRSYRERKRQAGVPTSRDVDSAWSEACAFELTRAGAASRVNIGVQRATRLSLLILERQGFDRQASIQALGARLGSIRDEHTWPDHMPSHNLDGRPLRPTKAGPWTTPEHVIRRFLAPSPAQSTDTPVTPSNAVSRDA